MRALLLAVALLASGCGATLAQQLSTAQTQATALRKQVTATMDPLCLAAAKSCPARPAPCPVYDSCDSTRHRIYQAASSVQVAIRGVALVASLDEAGAVAMLPGLLSQVSRLWLELKTLWTEAPASAPAGG